MPGAFPGGVWLTEVPPETPKTSLSCKEMKGFPYFSFPSFSRFRRPGPAQKERKTIQKPSKTMPGFSSKNGTPKKRNFTRKGSQNGSQNLPQVLPGTPRDPPRAPTSPQRLPRLSRETLLALMWHRVRAFCAPFWTMRDKFRHKIRSRFSTSPLYFEC